MEFETAPIRILTVASDSIMFVSSESIKDSGSAGICRSGRTDGERGGGNRDGDGNGESVGDFELMVVDGPHSTNRFCLFFNDNFQRFFPPSMRWRKSLKSSEFTTVHLTSNESVTSRLIGWGYFLESLDVWQLEKNLWACPYCLTSVSSPSSLNLSWQNKLLFLSNEWRKAKKNIFSSGWFTKAFVSNESREIIPYFG